MQMQPTENIYKKKVLHTSNDWLFAKP
jgi:hypothetical protein